MSYQEFMETIKNYITAHVDSNTKVQIQSVIKNNNIHLDGLTIIENNCNISPTIYLNYYYDEYIDGASMQEILKSIFQIYKKNKPDENIDVSFYTEYKNIKDKIVYKLINFEKNKDLLNEVPYYRYLDLAIVFYCLISTTPTGSATILVYNRHLDFWHITAEELYGQALINTPKILKHDLRSLNELMAELLSPVEYEEALSAESNSSFPMYVLSNKHKLYGASCLIYPQVLQKFAAEISSDLYILPSSVHEVILVPAINQSSCKELSNMVCEVNETQVIDEEILSDHVYFYSRETNDITI